MVTRDRFEQGLTMRQYIDGMRMNRERFARALDAAVIRPEDAKILDRLAGTARVLVITEDWCGTSLAHVPFVARLLEGRPDIDVRVFMRDDNPDIMEQYLKRGMYRSIPVFVFFDAEMNEIARFIEERPA